MKDCTILFDFPSPSHLGQLITKGLQIETGNITLRHFPDQEVYLRILNNVKDRTIIINASLLGGNDHILSLIFLADALRKQGAQKIILLAPYLVYMRQDKMFNPGEAITSQTFASLISGYFDALITVDPHLHRYKSLKEIYSIACHTIQSSSIIKRWIKEHIHNPFIIGPDEESMQWVQEIAGDFEYIVLNKTRFEDGHVEITWPKVNEEQFKNKTPVFVDDIISSGGTLILALEQLKQFTQEPAHCIAIHPLFSGDAYERLLQENKITIITTNSIAHKTNQIDLSELLISSLKKIIS